MASNHVDVLVLTALKEELDALLEVTAGVRGGWTSTSGDPPLHVAVLDGEAGPIRVAAVRQTKMAGVATASLAARLIERVKPRCLAMCGVCAGHPEDTDLGDVVIAERLFQHDEGKIRHDGFQGDLWVDALRDDWLRVAQDMAGPGTGFGLHAPPAGDAWTWWFLERLAAGRDPLRSIAFRRYIPDARRQEYLESLRTQDLVKLRGGAFELTRRGKAAIEEHRVLHGTLVTSHPFHIHVGPMGSGNAVEAGGQIWDRLGAAGMRKVLAVEMEAAAIGRVAHERGLPFAVVKGVMDHADRHKSDRFKGFAARISAEVLCMLLRRVVVPQVERAVSAAGTGCAVSEIEGHVSATEERGGENGESPPPPWVFLIYSRQSVDHNDAVLALADRLRSEGVEAWIDRYVPSPPEGWPAWIRHHVVNAKFVLVICTETFRRRFEGDHTAGPEDPGKGVAWEGLIASTLLYGDRSQNHRFIPILLPGAKIEDIPVELRSSTVYRLPEDYEELYRRLVGEARRPPPLGRRREPAQAQTAVSDGALVTLTRATPTARKTAMSREPAPRAIRDLSTFLGDRFDADELRRLAFFHGGPELDAALPGQHAPRSSVAFELVKALWQRGLLDDDFFADLTQHRPALSDQVAEIREAFTAPAPPAAAGRAVLDGTNQSGGPGANAGPSQSTQEDPKALPSSVVPTVPGNDEGPWEPAERAEIESLLLEGLREAPKLTAALDASLAARGIAPVGPPPQTQIQRVAQRIVALGRGMKAAQTLVDHCCAAVLDKRAPAASERQAARAMVEAWLPRAYGSGGRVVVLTLRATAGDTCAQPSPSTVMVDTVSPVVVEVHLARLDGREARFATRRVDVDGRRTDIVEGRARVPIRTSGPEILNGAEMARSIVRSVSRRHSLAPRISETMQLLQVIEELEAQADLDRLRHYVVFTGKESREPHFVDLAEHLDKHFNDNEQYGKKALVLRIVALAPEPGQGDIIPDHLKAEERLLRRLDRLIRGPVEDDDDAH